MEKQLELNKVVKDSNHVNKLAQSLNVIQKHYLMITSFLAFLFSLVCFTWVRVYFNAWGIEFFDYAYVSDMYTIAFKTGVVGVLFIVSVLILLGILFVYAWLFSI